MWVVEVFFNVLDYRGYFNDYQGEGEASLLQPRQNEHEPKTTKEFIALCLDVALAAYFFADSTTVAVHLSQEQIHREAKGMTLDVCINLFAYSFIVYRQMVDMRAQLTST